MFFNGLGLLTTTGGILMLSKKKRNPNNYTGMGEAYQDLIGGFFTAIGVIEVGVSIPLFVSSKKISKKKINLF